ncbi:hypothetical protein WJ438_40400 [Streptomyces sp. GD-15H]|uniref:hypothetical protein n=1 Tax=Streptomyces sp. GD-15H TaxID=3129112 RepID=UPI003252F769
MSAFQFLVEVLKSGAVQGLGLDARPDAWEAKLGSGYVDDVRKGRMRRDYGLVELSFFKEGETWQCFEVSLQIHRLAAGIADIVPISLIEEYGKLESRIKFSDLQANATAEGLQVAQIGDRGRHLHSRFSVMESRVIVHVLETDSGDILRRGDVWSVSLARDFTERAAPVS